MNVIQLLNVFILVFAHKHLLYYTIKIYANIFFSLQHRDWESESEMSFILPSDSVVNEIVQGQNSVMLVVEIIFVISGKSFFSFSKDLLFLPKSSSLE